MVNQCRDPAPTFEISNARFYKSNELKAIGLLVVQGNFLENQCREAIIALIDADREAGIIAISGMNLRTMTQVLKALVYQKLPAETSRFDRLLKHIETAIDYRNRTAHSLLIPKFVLGKLTASRARVRARKGQLSLLENEPLSVHQIKRRALFIHRAAEALLIFLADNKIQQLCKTS